ncbi:MAG: 30S ribosomal protein S11 [Nanoarchaeota archaeon]|nr:30S ribosomal protein S11 [Nanoarchaeota archaeon]
MGKKRVAGQTKEEALKESQVVKDTLSQKKNEGAKKKHDRGKVYVQASYNNTIMTVTDEKGNVVAWISAGSLGFKGPKKATPFAASKVAEALSEKLQKTGPFNVDVYVKGVGSGRDQAVRALAGKGFNIRTLKDVTPVPHNGPKPKKPRRV